MSDKEQCVFCVGEAASKWESMVNLQHYSCKNCGEYFIGGGSKSPSMHLRDILYNKEIQFNKYLISGYICEQEKAPVLSEN